jgi:hypothetical protein
MKAITIVAGALLRLGSDPEIVRICKLLIERVAVVLGRLS